MLRYNEGSGLRLDTTLTLPLAGTRETDVIDVDGQGGNTFFLLYQSVPDRVSWNMEDNRSAAAFSAVFFVMTEILPVLDFSRPEEGAVASVLKHLSTKQEILRSNPRSSFFLAFLGGFI